MALAVAVLTGCAVFFASMAFLRMFEKQRAFAVFSGAGNSIASRLRGMYAQAKTGLIAFNSKAASKFRRYELIGAMLKKLDLDRRYSTGAFVLMEELSAVMAVFLGYIIFENAVYAVLLGAGGFFVPYVMLSSALRKRTEKLISQLPDTLDIISAGIEGGLSLSAAVSRCAKKGRNEFASELRLASSRAELGLSFRDAMNSMKERLDFTEAMTFVDAIVRAEKSGGNVREIIRAQASEMRKKKFQNLKKKAHEAPVKLLIPLVLFIFPVIFLVLFGPIIIRIAQGF